MNNYTDILRKHNLKVTPQRLAITGILYKQGHINIEFLYEVMINLEKIIKEKSKLSTFKIKSSDLALSELCKNCQ